VVAFVAAVLIAVLPRGAGVGGDRVARLNVSGVITENRAILDAVDRLGKDNAVKAVILAVDSPGGSVAGGATLRAALIRLAAKKPLVAVMGGTAASAAYMISLPAARIFASDATLTGSIGVILETGEVSGLLNRIGVTATAITSGPLKDQPSFTRPLTPEGNAYLHGLVDDLFDQFVTMVADARHMDKARVKELADGRAYTGRQALGLGLVDQIGGEIEAREWLAKEKHVSDTLPIRDVSMGQPGFLRRATGALLGGMLNLAAHAITDPALQPGAWAIWQGPSAE
jgi:protease-4